MIMGVISTPCTHLAIFGIQIYCLRAVPVGCLQLSLVLHITIPGVQDPCMGMRGGFWNLLSWVREAKYFQGFWVWMVELEGDIFLFWKWGCVRSAGWGKMANNQFKIGIYDVVLPLHVGRIDMTEFFQSHLPEGRLLGWRGFERRFPFQNA